MRSRSNSLENVAEVKPLQMRVQFRRQMEGEDASCAKQDVSRKRNSKPPDDPALAPGNHKSSRHSRHRDKTAGSGKGRDLSRDDLLFLLSMLEGELQARDEVITVLKADKINLALLEAQYGFVTPEKVLQALQRDAIQGKGCAWQDDVYEKPMSELDKLVEKQRETYRRMLEQLLLVEQAHRQTLYRLEDEKRNHSEFMRKSDEFTNLLEQERERWSGLRKKSPIFEVTSGPKFT